MAFSPPTYNLVCNIWRYGGGPPSPPDVVCVGNLAYGKRESVPWRGDTVERSGRGAMWLLIPPTVDIRDTKDPSGSDVVEVPAGSGRIYDVAWTDYAGTGFSNMHIFAELLDRGPWPVPFPPPAPPSPPPTVPVTILNPPPPTSIITYPGLPNQVPYAQLSVFSVNPSGLAPGVTSSAGGSIILRDSAVLTVVGGQAVNLSVWDVGPWTGFSDVTITGAAPGILWSIVSPVSYPTYLSLYQNTLSALPIATQFPGAVTGPFRAVVAFGGYGMGAPLLPSAGWGWGGSSPIAGYTAFAGVNMVFGMCFRDFLGSDVAAIQLAGMMDASYLIGLAEVAHGP